MRNLGNTCYLDSCLLVMANLDETRNLFIGDSGFREVTGRLPTLLSRLGDRHGVAHVSLYDMLAQLIASLRDGQTAQLPLDFTSRILSACAQATTNSRWKNADDDAAEFYSWLVSALDVVQDQSSPIQGNDFAEKLDSGGYRWRAPLRPQELLEQNHQADLSGNRTLAPLAQYLQTHWRAYLQSGHASNVTELVTIQLLRQSQCDHPRCPTVLREVSYDYTLTLEFPVLQAGTQPVPLSRMFDWNMARDLGVGARRCENHSLHGEHRVAMRHQVDRVTRAPLIFALEIRRSRRLVIPDDATAQEADRLVREAERTPHLSRLGQYRSFDMTTLCNGAPRLQHRPELGVESPVDEYLDDQGLSDRYDLVAIVAYNHRIKHYIAFILVEGQWAVFDDLQQRVKSCDPFNDWPAVSL